MVNQPKKKKISFLVIVFILLFIFLGLSLISLFYFNQNSDGESNQEVKFWLHHSQNPIVGEKNTFFVFIQNKEKRDLENIEVTLKFPDSFVFDSSLPACQQKLNQGCFWFFDKISRHKLQEIEIKGNLFGQANQPQYFKGTVNFYLAGFTSIFQKNFLTPVIPEPCLLLNWQMPEQSCFGQEIKSFLFLENISQGIIPEIEVVVNWPQDFFWKDFQKTNFKKTISEELNVNTAQHQIKWKIKDLNPKEKRGINFSGLVKTATVDKLIFSLEAGLISKNDFWPQIKKEKKILLEEFDLQPVLEFNQSKEEKQSCSWGDSLPITLSYTNNTRQTIKDFALNIKIFGKNYIDFKRLYESKWYFYKGEQSDSSFLSGRMNSSLISPSSFLAEEEASGWDSVLIPFFKEIAPKSKGKIVFDLPLKSSLESTKDSDIQAEIILQILSQGKLNNQDLSWEVAGNKINLLIQTNLQLNSSLRYYDDERVVIGQGPLPLKAGEETHLWVFWRIKNTTNPVENISVKTKLSPKVNWGGQTKNSRGLLLYNQNNKEVSWQISELKSYQGGSYSLVEAGFEIVILPLEEQIGEEIVLTGPIYWQAKDKVTNDLLFQELSYLDTSLLKKDFWYQGSGKVNP